MSILVKNFQKSGLWSKYSKISILVKIVEKSQICRKISILVKIYRKFEFGQNFRKILFVVKVVGISWYWSKLTKMSILDEIAENVDYTQNFLKM